MENNTMNNNWATIRARLAATKLTEKEKNELIRACYKKCNSTYDLSDLEDDFFWADYRPETFFTQMVWADLVPMNELDEFRGFVKKTGGEVRKEEIFDEDDLFFFVVSDEVDKDGRTTYYVDSSNTIWDFKYELNYILDYWARLTSTLGLKNVCEEVVEKFLDKKEGINSEEDVMEELVGITMLEPKWLIGLRSR